MSVLGERGYLSSPTLFWSYISVVRPHLREDRNYNELLRRSQDGHSLWSLWRDINSQIPGKGWLAALSSPGCCEGIKTRQITCCKPSSAFCIKSALTLERLDMHVVASGQEYQTVLLAIFTEWGQTGTLPWASADTTRSMGFYNNHHADF